MQSAFTAYINKSCIELLLVDLVTMCYKNDSKDPKKALEEYFSKSVIDENKLLREEIKEMKEKLADITSQPRLISQSLSQPLNHTSIIEIEALRQEKVDLKVEKSALSTKINLLKKKLKNLQKKISTIEISTVEQVEAEVTPNDSEQARKRCRPHSCLNQLNEAPREAQKPDKNVSFILNCLLYFS